MKLHAHALMEMGHDLKFSLKGADIFTRFRGAFKWRYGPHGYALCVCMNLEIHSVTILAQGNQ